MEESRILRICNPFLGCHRSISWTMPEGITVNQWLSEVQVRALVKGKCHCSWGALGHFRQCSFLSGKPSLDLLLEVDRKKTDWCVLWVFMYCMGTMLALCWRETPTSESIGVYYKKRTMSEVINWAERDSTTLQPCLLIHLLLSATFQKPSDRDNLLSAVWGQTNMLCKDDPNMILDSMLLFDMQHTPSPTKQCVLQDFNINNYTHADKTRRQVVQCLGK